MEVATIVGLKCIISIVGGMIFGYIMVHFMENRDP